MQISRALFRSVGLGLLTAAMVCGSARTVSSLELRDNVGDVVELFTSQGCQPCPTADQLLSDLCGESGVLALAYHVGYWDYLGWEDTFAQPSNSELQRAYAQAWSTSRLYTPQMIVNGARGVVGSRTGDLSDALAETSLVLPVGLEFRGADAIVVTAGPRIDLAEAVVWLVTFRERVELNIEGGDNAGQRLAYTHIVTGRRPVGMWDPMEGIEIRIPISAALGSDNDGLALIIQEKRGLLPGRILGAAALH